MGYYIPHIGYYAIDESGPKLAHYGIKGMSWKNHTYKTPPEDRYWRPGNNNFVRSTVRGYEGDAITRGLGLRIRPQYEHRDQYGFMTINDKPTPGTPIAVVDKMKWDLMPTPDEYMNNRLENESKSPFRQQMARTRRNALKIIAEEGVTKPAANAIKGVTPKNESKSPFRQQMARTRRNGLKIIAEEGVTKPAANAIKGVTPKSDPFKKQFDSLQKKIKTAKVASKIKKRKPSIKGPIHDVSNSFNHISNTRQWTDYPIYKRPVVRRK